ncbi:hypothetical protein C0Q70_05362 [Pomacea canaliculata]|uniref:G-protein coupled receptors family 3 profile domain-containing protein n=1 Tax=Pomacea canaliculata TaxID=400727 RepID=A0A2T7PL01_POMCA|nr:hypothetical protein C0Q70_05362 [Pomacea canaliculata]
MVTVSLCSHSRQARQRGMYGPRHQWIILGDYSPDWWKITDSTVPCTPEMLNDTLDGYLATAVMPLSTDEELTEWGKTPEEYKRLYDLERGSEYSVYHGYAYDGIWVIAHALHRLLREEEMREGSNMAASLEELLRGARVGKALNDTNIRGVTGRVQFNNGDRVGVINILQMQGTKLLQAFSTPCNFSLLFIFSPRVWFCAGGRVPRDRTIQYEEMRHVSTPIYLTLVALSSIGVIMACCFLGLNIRFRRHRFIKMSSPNMNNIIIVGCILCYLSIVLLGTDGSIASSSPVVFRYWCRARAWVLALGFTLAFGAMFGKTWRVHAIFTNIKLNKKLAGASPTMHLVLREPRTTLFKHKHPDGG